MTDDISNVNPYQTGSLEWRQFEKYLRNRRLESAPAEVDVPPIDRDEAFQRDYIPLGRTGWEIQTKGKGSTYRICDKDGDRLAIPNEPYLHETLTRMARDVHADYATLARQLAEAKVDTAKWKSLSDAAQIGINVQHKREVRLQSQLAEATRRLGEAKGLVGKWLEEAEGQSGNWVEALRDCAGELNAALTKSNSINQPE